MNKFGRRGGAIIENKKLKRLLILQSFLPLMFLIFLKNFEFDLINLFSEFFTRILSRDFKVIITALTHKKFLLFIIVLGCILWILRGIVAAFQFRHVQNSNFIEGDKIEIKKYTSDSSLIFFTTFIVPLVIDDIGRLNNFLVFIGLLAIIIALMCKTNLYYQNPVITILGYNTFQFQFSECDDVSMIGRDLIGITFGKIDEGKIIKYQLIADDVYLIYNKI